MPAVAALVGNQYPGTPGRLEPRQAGESRPGVVQSAWPGMVGQARGRGIARALKCETLMQAMVLGVDRVRTDNDSTNVPILHINETMGYQRRADMVQFMKEL